METEGKVPEHLRADSTLKTLFKIDGSLLIKFVNGILGKSFDPATANVVLLDTEFHDAETYSRLQADLMFSIDAVLYHIEFQTQADSSMLIRIAEYGFSKAMSNARLHEKSYSQAFVLPAPVLIQADSVDAMPDQYEGSIRVEGSSCAPHTFVVPIVKLWQLNLEDIVSRQLYFLLPYVLMRYRRECKIVLPVTGEEQQTYQQAFRIVSKMIDSLFSKGTITQDVSLALKSVVVSLAKYLNPRLDNDLEFEKEVSIMEREVRTLQEIGEALGEARGKALGDASSRSEIARNMLRDGINVNFIAKYTRLSANEILKLSK